MNCKNNPALIKHIDLHQSFPFSLFWLFFSLSEVNRFKTMPPTSACCPAQSRLEANFTLKYPLSSGYFRIPAAQQDKPVCLSVLLRHTVSGLAQRSLLGSDRSRDRPGKLQCRDPENAQKLISTIKTYTLASLRMQEIHVSPSP